MDSIQQLQELLAEVAGLMKVATPASRRATEQKPLRIAAVASTLALTIQSRR